MSFEIAPLRALRFGIAQIGRSRGSPDMARGSQEMDRLVAPPYDIISPDEHRDLLGRSPHNVVRLTLGDRPGERTDYAERAKLLQAWKAEGILEEDRGEALYVYGTDYTVPGTSDRASFRGLLALGSLHDFAEKVVLPHERTFPAVVDDRFRLLEATRTHLEEILLLYSDRSGKIDGIIAGASAGPPDIRVEGKRGEFHSLWSIRDDGRIGKLRTLFRMERPIIADGHHRYTMARRYHETYRADPARGPGSGWQPMVLGNLFGEGLAILATHRLVSLGGRTAEGLRILEERLRRAPGGAPADLTVETPEAGRRYSFPPEILASRKGVSRTSYAILHDVILGEWLKPLIDGAQGTPGKSSAVILYFKEGTGEVEALRAGKGDLLFRMPPVDRREFREVVEGGEVFPHKTTFFYPKLWSGLVLWTMGEPGGNRAG